LYAVVAPARSSDVQFQLLDLQPAVRPVLLPPPPPVEESQGEELRRLRSTLESSIASKISSGLELAQSLARRQREEIIPFTLPGLDTLLGGGLARGKMLELSGGRSTAGRFSSVLAALASVTSMGEAGALVDLGDHFDPRLAEEDGIDLRRLLWARPKNLKDAVHAAEMLVSTGFSMVVVDAGVPPVRGRVPDASWIRLARSAELRNCALLISSPYPITGSSAEGMVTMQRASAQWLGGTRAPRLLTGVSSRLLLDRHRRLRPGREAGLSFVTVDSIRRSPSQEAR
jgi:hypothetical protein